MIGDWCVFKNIFKDIECKSMIEYVVHIEGGYYSVSTAAETGILCNWFTITKNEESIELNRILQMNLEFVSVNKYKLHIPSVIPYNLDDNNSITDTLILNEDVFKAVEKYL